MWEWGHGVGMGLWWAVGLVLVVGVVWAVARIGREPRGPDVPSAEEALRRRYAAGEIDEDEFRRRLATLRGGSPDDVG